MSRAVTSSLLPPLVFFCFPFFLQRSSEQKIWQNSCDVTSSVSEQSARCAVFCGANRLRDSWKRSLAALPWTEDMWWISNQAPEASFLLNVYLPSFLKTQAGSLDDGEDTHTHTHSGCDARWCANDLALGWRNRKSGCVRRLLRWIDSAARRRCIKRLNPVFSGMIVIYRHPDENTFLRRSRPAASSLAESFITLSALNSFLFNKWIKVFHSTARYTSFEEMRPATDKMISGTREEKKKKPHYFLQLKLRDHSHLWNALRSSSHLFFLLRKRRHLFCPAS